MPVDGEAKVFVELAQSRSLEPPATSSRWIRYSLGRCKRADFLRWLDVRSYQESLGSWSRSFDASIAEVGEGCLVSAGCSCLNAVEGRPRVEVLRKDERINLVSPFHRSLTFGPSRVMIWSCELLVGWTAASALNLFCHANYLRPIRPRLGPSSAFVANSRLSFGGVPRGPFGHRAVANISPFGQSREISRVPDKRMRGELNPFVLLRLFSRTLGSG